MDIESFSVKQLLSPRDLAEALGVSESSLKRWADAGRINVARTSGGHRRIAIAEAVRFIRASGISVVRPELLGMGEVSRGRARGDDDELYRLLYAGLGRETRAWLLARFLTGESIASLADGPIRGAMTRLGTLGNHESGGVFIEHRATDCCIQAVSALRALVDVEDGGPVALGGAPSGDPYVLPTMLAAAVLSADGMKAHNLGPDTPLATLRHAAAIYRPALVWLACSSPVSAASSIEIDELARSLQDDGTNLVVGGRHAGDLAGARAVVPVSSMAELAAFARGIVSERGG